MRRRVLEVGVALVAALIAEGIFALADLFGTRDRWIAIGIVFVVVLALTLVVGGRVTEEETTRHRVASKLRSRKSVKIKDIKVHTSGAGVEAASNIKSRGEINISGIRVADGEDESS